MENTDQTFENAAGIAGTGKLAKALGALLVRRDVTVSAIAGRSLQSAEEARAFTGAERAVTLRELPRYARRIVIAVNDEAIPDVAAELAAGGLQNGVVLHTSGAAGPWALEILRGAGNSTGALHPLQTVPSAELGVASLPGAAWAFAGDPDAMVWAEWLIRRLQGRPLAVDPEFWPHYHAGAVMACNYQVTLVDAALELMGMAGIARNSALDALAPILRATTENILAAGPERALTGPVARGDAGTIEKHIAAMASASPATARLYAAAGLRTVEIAERAGLESARARKIERVLEEMSLTR